jgi:hypothetical protein
VAEADDFDDDEPQALYQAWMKGSLRPAQAIHVDATGFVQELLECPVCRAIKQHRDDFLGFSRSSSRGGSDPRYIASLG